MKRRFGKGIIYLLLLIFFGGVSVLAISKSSVSCHVFSKKVAIRIAHYTKKNDAYISWEDTGITVLPGEFISRIPIIYNEGTNCYVRAQVKITSVHEPSVPITMSDIVGMDEKWLLIGDYFYYEDILLEDKEIKFFDGIYIPTEWVSAIDCGNQWEVQVKVDAVQAEYMHPDFHSDDPWGEQKENIDILEAKEDELLEDEEMKQDFVFTIESKTETFQIGIEEIFQNMTGFVPGDVKEQKIKIRNLDEKERILYMKAEMLQENKFLDGIETTIWWENKMVKTILYQGPVTKIHDVLEEISFVVPGNSEHFLHIILALPKETDNTYSAQEGSLHFMFSDKTIPHKDSVAGEFSAQEHGLVQTGDNNKIWNGIVGLSFAVCLFFLYIWKGKRECHDFQKN